MCLPLGSDSTVQVIASGDWMLHSTGNILHAYPVIRAEALLGCHQTCDSMKHSLHAVLCLATWNHSHRILACLARGMLMPMPASSVSLTQSDTACTQQHGQLTCSARQRPFCIICSPCVRCSVWLICMQLYELWLLSYLLPCFLGLTWLPCPAHTR